MSPPEQPQTPASVEQLIDLNKRIDAQFSEIKLILAKITEKQSQMELREAGCSPIMTGRLDAAWRRVDDHEVRIKSLEVDMPKKADRETVDEELRMINETLVAIKQTNKLLSWVGGILSSAILLWVLENLLAGIK